MQRLPSARRPSVQSVVHSDSARRGQAGALAYRRHPDSRPSREHPARHCAVDGGLEAQRMNRIIYIVGLIVVVLAVLWFFGLR
ncbi:MAG: hypothetical protein EPN98_17490 [Phenylobacterium sp.]|nr:MAG: hypothetical protein EPN98_17490 [Phenylobacterium sp.]